MLQYLLKFIDIILHIDTHLNTIISTYGAWTYGILFTVVFFETAMVFTPFLPGDSLLFAAGAFAAMGSLNLPIVLVLLMLAAIIGDTVNYQIGMQVGPRVFTQETGRFFKKEYLTKTEAFYAKHGPKTVVLARFFPIIRTFAPFVAGIGRMYYPKFLVYNVIGAVLWVIAFTMAGYFFGTIPIVADHFTLVIFGIIAISLVPAFKAGISHWLHRRKQGAPAPDHKTIYRPKQ